MMSRYNASLLTVLALAGAVATVEGCSGATTGKAAAGSTDLLSSSTLLFIQRQTTTVVKNPDGTTTVTVDVDGGNGQVLDYQRWVPGGSLNLLSPARADGTRTNLTASYTTADFNGADVSFDATQAVFSMKTGMNDHYHIYTVQLTPAADGSYQVHQLTGGMCDDINPIYVPNGQIAFVTNQMYTQMGTRVSTDENTRYQDLVQKGAGTVQRAQQASSDFNGKRAALDAANAAKVSAERQIDVLDAQKVGAAAQLDQAKAQKDRADADLQRTELRATVDGRVTKLTAAVGALAAPGQAIMIVVPLDIWVTANFKELQLADMRAGQPVDIRIDAFGGRSFPGQVNSVQAGSGTAFSLLPAENATGNYVKVVQRVPVKITFNQRPDVELGPGMSVVPTVTVRP